MCCQAAADERESCDNNVSSLCTKIVGNKSVWLAPIIKPVGDYPSHWNDGVHDCDGHGIKDRADDDKGEVLLNGELSALYVREGVAQAVDDVSGAFLDPGLVAEARALEMKFFNDMRVYDRVPRAEMIGAKSSKQDGLT